MSYYREHQADFLEGLAKNKPASPTFRDALETQYVCDAVLKSAKTGRWEKVKVKQWCRYYDGRWFPMLENGQSLVWGDWHEV